MIELYYIICLMIEVITYIVILFCINKMIIFIVKSCGGEKYLQNSFVDIFIFAISVVISYCIVLTLAIMIREIIR
jgi:hypothetical protein